MHTDAFKKLTTEIKNALFEKLSTAEFQDFITKTKAASDSDAGTFEVVISTADKDRQGEIVDQNGWILDNYLKNPVVLFGHNYYELPVGVCDDIKVIDGKLVAKGRFAPADANPFAQQVRKMYDAGMLKTTSVGFIPLEFDNENTILKAELLEFSFVPVPANPYALSLREIKELGLDLNMLVTKSILFSVKENPAQGDDEEGDNDDDSQDGPNNAEALEHLRELLKAEHGEHVKGFDIHTTTLVKAIMGDGEKTVEAKSIDEFKAICTKAIDEFKTSMVGEHDRHSGEMMKVIDEFEKELPGDEEQSADDPKSAKAEKSGRVISKKNREVLAEIGEHAKAVTAAVEDLMADPESADDDSDGSEGGDEKAQKKGRKLAGHIDGEAFKTFLAGREVLRDVATIISGSLERYNKTAREIRK